MPPFGRLMVRRERERRVGKRLVSGPGEVLADVVAKRREVRGHDRFGQLLLPADIGIVAQVLEGALEVSEDRRARDDADPSDVGPHVLGKEEGLERVGIDGGAVRGGDLESLSSSDVERKSKRIAVHEIRRAHGEDAPPRRPWSEPGSSRRSVDRARPRSPARLGLRTSAAPETSAVTVSVRISSVRFITVKRASKRSPSMTWFGRAGRISVGRLTTKWPWPSPMRSSEVTAIVRMRQPVRLSGTSNSIVARPSASGTRAGFQ